MWTISGPTGFSHGQISEQMRVRLLFPLVKEVLHIYSTNILITVGIREKASDLCYFLK